LARQPHHPAHRKGHNNRSIGRATAVRQQHQQPQLKQEKRQYFVHKTTAALARQQQPPPLAALALTTAASAGQQHQQLYIQQWPQRPQPWQGNRIILHTKQLRFKQQWQGNSGTLRYGMATTTTALAGQQHHHCEQQCYNNRSIGTATAFDSPTHGNCLSCEIVGLIQGPVIL
jgi:hypothetical protein